MSKSNHEDHHGTIIVENDQHDDGGDCPLLRLEQGEQLDHQKQVAGSKSNQSVYQRGGVSNSSADKHSESLLAAQQHLLYMQNLDGQQSRDGIVVSLCPKATSTNSSSATPKQHPHSTTCPKNIEDNIDYPGYSTNDIQTTMMMRSDIKKQDCPLSGLNIMALNDNSANNSDDSNSQESSSSSIAFADHPSLDDVADDLSDISDLELNFDGPIEWPDRTTLTGQSGLGSKLLKSSDAVPSLENAAANLLLYQGEENPELQSVDPRTQARLEALLEAAGIGKLSTTDGKAFADPEVLRKLTSSVSCALDEAAAALTRMRAETQSSSVDNDKTLAEACSDGDVDAVKRLLSEGSSVHETNEEGESLLSLACSAGYYELAEVLLRMRANVEDRGIKGDCTPLMEASSGGFENVVRLLVAYDADVNAQSSAGHTALHHAAVGGHRNVVQLLIASGANVEEQNENGHTPLMESASAGHVGVAKILLNAGAGINTHSNEFKESALTLACYKGHLEMVKFLLDAGADQEHKTDEMHTALMEASMDGHVEVARLLLDSGAQVNMPADSFESPLTLAACGGHVDLASLLIERGANLEEVNDEGYTPLMEASREGHDEMVILLIANGADINAQTEETQETALTLACCGGFVEVAHYLIEANADLELGCSTPLMEAAQEGHIELVKYLIKMGSEIQALTGTNDSALTYACENGHTDVVDVLLQAGAKLEHESEGGRTPLMKAARAGHLCTVQFLISKGANVNRSTANNEHTVLSLACAGGHLGVVELLLEHSADPMHKLKDGSTMLIEAAKGGHTAVVNLLLDYPNGLHKSVSTAAPTAAVSSEYPDSIPMADDLPADTTSCKDLSLKSTESLATRLEQFIHKMMSQAENSSGTREEQMARKQEILEELQRVEQELKFRTQLAQDNQHLPLGYEEPSSGDQNGHAFVPLSLSPLPNMIPSHEYVEQELQQKQQAIAEQQRHEAQLQQQKEYYQAKLQLLKHQYQQKQLQLQQQRQQLLSQAANNPTVASSEYSETEVVSRQAIPLHIALQNHLHAHHVTEGNVDDLAQALQEWDTRDRNIRLLQSQVKPMPTFNLNSKHEEINNTGSGGLGESVVSELSLPIDDMPFTETPPSRSLADSLATLIQGMDYQPPSIDTSLANAIENSSSMKRPRCEYEALQTLQTLQWLKKMDAACGSGGGEGSASSEPLSGAAAAAAMSSVSLPSQLADLVTVPKTITKRAAGEFGDKQLSTNSISKVLNGYVSSPSDADLQAILSMNDPAAASTTTAGTVKTTTSNAPSIAGRPAVVVPPTAQRSVSPPPPPASFVDPNAETDSNHDTALTLACAGGHAQLVKLLLSRNAEIEHRDKKGFTPLILASTAGHSDVVEILIDNHAEVEAQSERTKDTPLSLACSGGRYEVVEILLRLGANKEHRNVSDYTPLSLAASGGYVNIIKLLLSYGAEINSRTGSKLGISPLMLAAMNGHTAAVKLLLDMGSDINAQIETNRNTALTLACFQGRHDVVSLLVDRKANIEHRAKTGLTPLMEAASGGYVDVGKVLLDKAADVNAPPVPSSKDTALTIAADKGHYRFVELLLSRGAAVDVKNKKGNSPLWLACNGGHLDVVQLLVSNHADIDSQDNRRVSSLMAAFRRGHIKVVKWLVRHVTQFPGDPELSRYIATVSDQELLKKCQQCMTVIHQAKEQQNTEAMKNASILLKEVEFEKSREEKRKEAAARKREKKKQKRKERQAEQQQGDKASPEPTSVDPSELSTVSDEEGKDQVVPSTGQSCHDSLIIDINDGTALLHRQTVQKKNNVNVKRSDTGQHKNNGDPNVYYSSRIEEQADKENSAMASSRKNRRNKVKNTGNMEFVDPSQPALRKDANKGIAELDDFGDLPLPSNSNTGARFSSSKRSQNQRGSGGGVSSSISQLDSFDGGYVNHPNKYGSPGRPTKPIGPSPSPGKKRREDGTGGGSDWKQVTNKKGKKIAVPSKCVSIVSKSIHAIKDKSGAQIEFEKAAEKRSGGADKKKLGGGGDRNIIIRGSADAIRSAHSLVSALLKDSTNETENQSYKKSSSTVGSSNSNSSLSAASQSQQRAGVSSIGVFNLADYVRTTTAPQVTVPATEGLQSRPGWPVRPSIAGQSAWGQPGSSRPSSANDRPQQVGSPRTVKPSPGIRMPAAVMTAQPQTSPLKHPNEVSRQLFPESTAYLGQPHPSSTSAMSPVVPMPNQLLPSQFNTQQRSPMQLPPNMTGNIMSAGMSSQSVTGGPLPPPSMPTTSSRARPHPMIYSPFDNQAMKPLLAGNKPGYHSATLDRSHVDPNKAPGFRPSVSPQLGQYPSAVPQSSAHQNSPASADDLQFSGGNRGLSGLHVATSSTERLMAPLTSMSISTNIHALFSGDSNGMSEHLHPSSTSLDNIPLLSLQDRYTTIDQPMTLPRISSSLNPNASVFNAPSRFGGDIGPNGIQQTGPSLMMPQQGSSPVNYMSASDEPSLLHYQSQRDRTAAVTSVSSQSMMHGGMFPSPNLQSLSLATDAGAQLSKQDMQQATVPDHHASFSPSSSNRQLVTPTSASGGSIHQMGDGAHRVKPSPDEDNGASLINSMNPIGGERSFKQPSMFRAVPDIWSSSKVNDGEWGNPGMNMPMMYHMGEQTSRIPSANTATASLNDSLNDPAFLRNVFKPTTNDKPESAAMRGIPPAMAVQYQFYPGGAGDGVQNTWHNPPTMSKLSSTQSWSGWDQTNTGA